jgi:hypothetical protein
MSFPSQVFSRPPGRLSVGFAADEVVQASDGSNEDGKASPGASHEGFQHVFSF